MTTEALKILKDTLSKPDFKELVELQIYKLNNEANELKKQVKIINEEALELKKMIVNSRKNS